MYVRVDLKYNKLNQTILSTPFYQNQELISQLAFQVHLRHSYIHCIFCANQTMKNCFHNQVMTNSINFSFHPENHGNSY